MAIHPQNSTIGVGFVGYGLAGAILHAPVIEALPDYRLVAVATSRAAAANRRDRPQVVPDVDALLAIEGVDLVVVVTPNDSHSSIAAAALSAGRHVVIDKPMAPTVAECDALIDLAGQSDRLLSVYHNRRWDGDFVAARAEVARERPALFAAAWDRFRPTPAGGWRDRDVPGAGLLWDLGPHMIDQAIELFGWPDAMTADIATQREGAQADDYFEVMLTYGDRRVTISGSSLIAAARPRFALHGFGGSWWTKGFDPGEALLRGGTSTIAADSPLRVIPAFRATAEGEAISEPIPAGEPLAFYRAMAAAIRREAPVPVDPIDARNVVALIAAAHEGGDLPLPRPRAAF